MDKKYPEYYEIVKGCKRHKSLNLNNWWYVQLNASIITAFGKYKMDYPQCVFVETFGYTTGPTTQITIVRNNFKNDRDAKKWYDNLIFVQSALNLQAEANSTDDMKFKFVLI